MTAELRDELAANNRQLAVNTRGSVLRFHHLKAMGQSPAHCLASFADDKRKTPQISIGSGTHGLLLGKPVIEYPGKVRRGKEWEAFRSLHPFATILSRSEMAVSRRVVEAIKAHPIASSLLFAKGVEHEKSIAWTQQGRERQSTPDALCGTDYLVELKTTRCAEPGRFARDAMYRGYHAQVADQCAAVEAREGKRPAAAYIIAVESGSPHAVTVLKLTDRALEQGAKLCRLWFERFIACELANSWPAYCEAVTDFDVPDDELDLVFADDGDDEDES